MGGNHGDNHTAGHEERDVNVIAITRFGIGLALTVAVAMVALWGLFDYFKKQVSAAVGEAPGALVVNTSQLPPQPRLQASPRADLREMRAGEEQVLDHYGWVDHPGGVVRIPIQRAMDILARKGLPARAQAPPPLGSRNNPTQSSAGEILQQPGGPLAPQLGGAAQGTHP